MTRASDTARLVSGGAVFNEASNDVDFRVESDGNTNALIVDAGHSTVGINTAAVSNRTVKIEGEGNTGAILSLNEETRGGLVEFSAGSGTELYVGSELGILGSGNNNELLIHTGVSALKIDRTGAVTKPNQPAFLAGPLTGASAQSGLSTGSDVTIILGNEIYDVNGDFASNTFTAPVTGKYQLSANITYNHFDEDSTQVQSGIKTSNRNYINQIDPDIFQEDADIITMTLTVVADMDANDTATVFYNQTGGSSQTNVGKETTTFSGCLLA